MPWKARLGVSNTCHKWRNRQNGKHLLPGSKQRTIYKNPRWLYFFKIVEKDFSRSFQNRYKRCQCVHTSIWLYSPKANKAISNVDFVLYFYCWSLCGNLVFISWQWDSKWDEKANLFVEKYEKAYVRSKLHIAKTNVRTNPFATDCIGNYFLTYFNVLIRFI